MFKNRSGRPSLIGSAARTAGKTALIVGTANAVSGAQRNRAVAKAVSEDASLRAADGGLSEEGIARLRKIAEFHQSGILSDDEFAEQKSRILNG